MWCFCRSIEYKAFYALTHRVGKGIELKALANKPWVRIISDLVIDWGLESEPNTVKHFESDSLLSFTASLNNLIPEFWKDCQLIEKGFKQWFIQRNSSELEPNTEYSCVEYLWNVSIGRLFVQQLRGFGFIVELGTFPKPWGERIYVTWYAVSVFIVPFVILAATHFHICREIWLNLHKKRKSFKINKNRVSMNRKADSDSDSPNLSATNSQQTMSTKVLVSVGKSYRFRGRGKLEVSLDNEFKEDFSPRTHSIHGLSRAKIKTVKITVVVILCYVICSSPFICVQLWAYWVPSAQESHIWNVKYYIVLSVITSSLTSRLTLSSGRARTEWSHSDQSLRSLWETALDLCFKLICVNSFDIRVAHH